jgi:DNA-binding response OmpR family regulator
MNVLAVDDERDTRTLLNDLLTEVGHHVVTAANAREARAALEREPIDVVLLDLMMPGTDGLEFARSMSENWGTLGIPFIVVSCRRDEESKGCARIFGCARYLEKPFDPLELIEAIGDIERGQQENAELGA